MISGTDKITENTKNRHKLCVLKRDGSKVPVRVDCITDRIDELCSMSPELDVNIDPFEITQLVVARIQDGISTSLLDSFTADICASKITEHPHYGILASRLVIDDHHKTLMKTTGILYSEVVEALHNNIDQTGQVCSLVDEDIYQMVMNNKDVINNIIDIKRDFLLDFFGFKTLYKNYLLKINTNDKKNVVVECPQHMFLRVALGIHIKFYVSGKDTFDQLIQRVKETYELISNKYYTHATPTLFNSGTPYPSLVSCFLLGIDDSIDGIYKCLSDSAKISKWSGGIGIHITNIRARGSYIRKTAGKSDGIVPMLKVFNDTARYVNQCFVPETIIYTRDGPKEIQHIKVGDYVITHDGTFKPVMDIFSRHISENIRKIKTNHTINDVMCTDVHQILARDSNGKMEYISAVDLTTEHYTYYPLNHELELDGGYSNVIYNKEVFYEGLVYDLSIQDNHNYLTQMGIVHNSGKRLGSIAMYIEPWHADVFDFLEAKTPHGDPEIKSRDLFYAMWIPDLFMKRVEEDGDWYLMCPSKCQGLSDAYDIAFEELYQSYVDRGLYEKKIKARELWDRIITTQIESGVPYISFKDAANRKTNHKNIGTIKSSNLCVAPETRILTDKGYFPIHSLKDKEVNVWNGTEWSKTVVTQTGTNQKLIEVNLSNGVTLNCTEYHKFYIEKGTRPADKSVFDTIEARNLKPGMKLIKFNLPVIKNDEGPSFPYAYTHGLFCSEGTYNINKYGRYPIMSLYGEKQNLINNIEMRSSSLKPTKEDKINVTLPFDIPEKFTVPINYNLESKLRWFEGVCDGDGTVAKNGTNHSLQVCSIHKEYLVNISLMLQTIGVFSKVTLAQLEGEKRLPDGKGSHKMYKTKKAYRLLINSNGVKKLQELGFSPKRLIILPQFPQRDATFFVKVESIKDNNRIDDTYCFNESKLHRGIFEGICTGQCNEIYEYSDAEKYACCVLSSVVLPSYVRDGKFDHGKLYDVARVIVRNLDRLIDINYYPVPETKKSNFSERPLGIGVQGLADVFFKLKIPYDSEEASRLNREIFETLYYATLKESNELSKLYGPYETFDGSPASKGILQFDMWEQENNEKDFLRKKDISSFLSGRYDWDGLKKDIIKYGLRNSLLTALMPTASTAQIMATTVEAFEPITSNVYTRRTLAGEFIIINQYLMNDLMNLGLWTSKIKSKIIKNRGSVTNIKEIPENIRNVYKTCWELKQKVLIDMSSDRGVFIDQSQSLNLFFEVPEFNKLNSALFYSWKSGLKTGSYYIRSKPAVNAITIDIDEESDDEHEEIIQNEDNIISLDGIQSGNEETCEMCSS